MRWSCRNVILTGQMDAILHCICQVSSMKVFKDAYTIPVEQCFIPRIEQFIQNNTRRSTVVLQAWQAWLQNVDTEESEV